MSQSSGGEKRKIDRSIRLLFYIILTVVPVFFFYYTYIHYYHAAVFYNKGNYLFALLYTAILIVFMSVYNGYKLRKYRTRELVLSFALASLFTDLIMFVVMCLIAEKLLPPYYVILTFLLQCCVETMLYMAARILNGKLEARIPSLYICDGDKTDPLLSGKFDKRRTEYGITSTVNSSLSWDMLVRAIDRHQAVVIGEVERELRAKIMEYCFHHDKKVLLLPDMTDVMLCNAEATIMSDKLMYTLHTEEPEPVYHIAKRGLDILASALALLILSPLMLIVAALIKAYDRGPVFYKQTRLTKGGREFKLIKFRSMIVNAESATGAVLAGKKDARITPVGRFIRATRIDELPQLWNILVGDMTLVGPRPERPEFYEEYCAEYPEFAYRLHVTAGLTGYAQLYGKYNTTFIDKAKLDMHYIQNASFWLDLQLLFYTLKIVFVKESTEGVEEKTEEKETVSAK